VTYRNSDRTILALVLATYAKAAGLSRAEATDLGDILGNSALPWSVDMAWLQLEEATLAIRRRRDQPPLQQQPPPWRDQ
jgi:hypothetical protein